jgi:nicotinamide-nucleotide amidase
MPNTVTADDLDYVQVDQALIDLAIDALSAAERGNLKVITAESCTGGLISTVLSEAPGAAEHFEGAFVCYTADHKCAALGLDPGLIERCGAVSAGVAKAMAEAALQGSTADIAVAVTGVAGPDKDEKGNPVGLVFLACARRQADTTCLKRNFGDIGRARIRYRAAAEALILLAQAGDQGGAGS